MSEMSVEGSDDFPISTSTEGPLDPSIPVPYRAAGFNDDEAGQQGAEPLPPAPNVDSDPLEERDDPIVWSAEDEKREDSHDGEGVAEAEDDDDPFGLERKTEAGSRSINRAALLAELAEQPQARPNIMTGYPRGEAYLRTTLWHAGSLAAEHSEDNAAGQEAPAEARAAEPADQRPEQPAVTEDERDAVPARPELSDATVSRPIEAAGHDGVAGTQPDREDRLGDDEKPDTGWEAVPAPADVAPQAEAPRGAEAVNQPAGPAAAVGAEPLPVAEHPDTDDGLPGVTAPPETPEEEQTGWRDSFTPLALLRPRFTQGPAHLLGGAFGTIPIQPHTRGVAAELPDYVLGGGYVRGLIGSLLPQLQANLGTATSEMLSGGGIIIRLREPLPDVVPGGGIQVFVETARPRLARKTGRELANALREGLSDSAYDEALKAQLLAAVHTDYFKGSQSKGSLAAPKVWLSEESVPPGSATARRGLSADRAESGESTIMRAIHLGYLMGELPNDAFASCILEDMDGTQIAIMHPMLETMLGRLLDYTVLNVEERRAIQRDVSLYVEVMKRIGLERQVMEGEEGAATLIKAVREAYSWNPGEIIAHLTTSDHLIRDLIPRIVGKASRITGLAASNPAAPLHAIASGARAVGKAVQRRTPEEEK